MRIPGIGGEVMGRLGAVPQALPGSEIYAALERGVIDAAEWVGPYDDEKLGLYKIAKHYYYPAFWEGGTELCVMINAAAWDKLPKLYQEVVESAAAEAHVKMQAQYDAKNPIALKSLIANGVKLHPFPRDLLRAANKAAFELYEAEAAKNPAFKKLYEPWKKFREQQYEWFSHRGALVRVVCACPGNSGHTVTAAQALAGACPAAWRDRAGGGCHAGGIACASRVASPVSHRRPERGLGRQSSDCRGPEGGPTRPGTCRRSRRDLRVAFHRRQARRAAGGGARADQGERGPDLHE